MVFSDKQTSNNRFDLPKQIYDRQTIRKDNELKRKLKATTVLTLKKDTRRKLGMNYYV